MKSRSQIILAASLVALATVLVGAGVFARAPQDQATAGAQGHDHSAMSAASDEAQPVTLSEDAARRIGVTFATVTRGSLPRTVHTVGNVTFDETRLTSVSPKIEGWVERLFVDFTGSPVLAGQPLLEIYSPALITAQEELLLARGLREKAMETGGERARETAEELLAGARRRLAYWDIPEEEIRQMEERGSVTRTLTLRAPSSGVVVEKNVVEGDRIMPGMNLFRVADLSRVWVEAEVFEKDLSLVREGQHGMVTFESYPGEVFHGSVTYIYPTVSSSARTGRVRLELQNPGLRLKPGMYADVELTGAGTEETLLVPRSAVLQTGERSMVFHRMSNGQLHPMEVVTGLSSGDQIQILSGLTEGTVVVSSATFLIDAESNLGAAMAGMAGMDMGGMDMGGGEVADSSAPAMPGMDMPGMDPDTSGGVR